MLLIINACECNAFTLKSETLYNFNTYRIDAVTGAAWWSCQLGIRPAVLFSGSYVFSKYVENQPSFWAVKFSRICIVTADKHHFFTNREEIQWRRHMV